jgi:hypothetical protein
LKEQRQYNTAFESEDYSLSFDGRILGEQRKTWENQT